MRCDVSANRLVWRNNVAEPTLARPNKEPEAIDDAIMGGKAVTQTPAMAL